MNGFYVFKKNQSSFILFLENDNLYHFCFGHISYTVGCFVLEEFFLRPICSCWLLDEDISRFHSDDFKKLTKEEVKLCWLIDNRLFDILDEEYRRNCDRI